MKLSSFFLGLFLFAGVGTHKAAANLLPKSHLDNSTTNVVSNLNSSLEEENAIQYTYEVSPDGEGIHSLQGAHSDIRTKTASMTGDIVVLLDDGVYTLNETLLFDVADGGKDNYKVIYKAKKGAKPIISGGIQLTNWQQSSENPNLYYTTVEGLQDIRNFYVNGNRAKKSQSSVKRSTSGLYVKNGKKIGVVFSKNDISFYENPSDVEINYMHCWRNYHFMVDDIVDGAELSDVNNDSCLVKIKNFNWSYTMAYSALTPGAGEGPMNRFYFENAMELLDNPGEWYYNTVSKKIYYYPYQGEDMNNIETVVPNLEYLIKIKSSQSSNVVKNIVFEGLKFAYNAWTWPCEHGFAPIQGSAIINSENTPAHDDGTDYQKKIKIPGAISVDGAEDLVFRSNIFMHLGSNAIDLRNNTNRVTIERNSFYDVSASAISLASWVHRTMNKAGEKPIDNTLIKNNYIEKIGAEYASSVAIEAFYTQNLTIDHNDLYDLPYTGISIGWGWHISASSQKNVRVTNNKIVGVIQKCYDGGGIYSLSTFGDKGLFIGGNYIDEITLKPNSSREGTIYTDEQSSNVYISNNVIKSERKWFYFNSSGSVTVDTMHVIAGYGGKKGGNTGSNTKITYVDNGNRIWGIPNDVSNAVIENAGMVKGEEAPVVSYPNLALGKVARSRSNYSGYSEKSINDGSINSFWHSGDILKPWCYVDLDAPYYINKIELVTQQTGTSYEETRRNFLIELCNYSSFLKGTTDTVYVCGADPIGERSTLIVDVPASDKSYRYVRVIKTKYQEHLAVAELRIFGSDEPLIDTAIKGIDNSTSTIKINYLPSKDYLSISALNSLIKKNLKLKILDFSGRLFYHKKLTGLSSTILVPLKFLPKGVYLATVNGEGVSLGEKFIK